jgi:hypothetical protein
MSERTMPEYPRNETLVPARFTVDGGEALERHLAKICAEVCAGVQEVVPAHLLEGLLLGGGYGRGEGGVLRMRGEELPYNDLEFYVFVRGSAQLAERRYRAALHKLGHDLEAYAGVEVEFKVVSRQVLMRSGTTMFFYDLVSGHHRIFGDASILDGCEHQRLGEQIPLHEASRLLMNRCSGLLFSAERLSRGHFTAEDSDFVGRNCSKAELALGDSVLTALGMYHHSVRRRSELLDSLPASTDVPRFAELVQLHRKGTEFKLHPVFSRESREVLQARFDNLRGVALQVFLWLEGRRLGRAFDSARTYASDGGDKFPEAPGWRSPLVNMKAFGFSALGTGMFRHPRWRLLESLSLLLWEDDALRDSKHLAHLARCLRRAPLTFADAVAAYTALWHRFQ